MTFHDFKDVVVETKVSGGSAMGAGRPTVRAGILRECVTRVARI